MELKPCPFCGSKEPDWIDHPSDCYLHMIVDQVDSNCMRHYREAVESAWNRRAKSASKTKRKPEIVEPTRQSVRRGAY